VLGPFAFWDSSILVPLCVSQLQTSQSLRFQSKYQMECGGQLMWRSPALWPVYCDIIKSPRRICARYRCKRRAFANLWRVVAPSKNVALEAGFLLERYRLRAAVASRSNAPFETATLDAGAPVQQSTGNGLGLAPHTRFTSAGPGVRLLRTRAGHAADDPAQLVCAPCYECGERCLRPAPRRSRAWLRAGWLRAGWLRPWQHGSAAPGQSRPTGSATDTCPTDPAHVPAQRLRRRVPLRASAGPFCSAAACAARRQAARGIL